MNERGFKNYMEVREAHTLNQLQVWDGETWTDIDSKETSLFFARDLDHYRRKLPEVTPVPHYYTVEFAKNQQGASVKAFYTAEEVADSLWGKDMDVTHVYKRVVLKSLDLRKIMEQLEKI